jgi:hypothetical protein
MLIGAGSQDLISQGMSASVFLVGKYTPLSSKPRTPKLILGVLGKCKIGVFSRGHAFINALNYKGYQK